MRSKFVGVAVLMAAVAVLLPGSALSNVNLDAAICGAVEFDTRVGTVAPTKAQRRHVKRLKASVTWSQFGTPRRSSATARPSPVASAARIRPMRPAGTSIVTRGSSAFRSLDALAFVSANRLGDSKGWAVTYRQVFDGLQDKRERHGHRRRRREPGSRLEDRLGLLEPHWGPSTRRHREALGRRGLGDRREASRCDPVGCEHAVPQERPRLHAVPRRGAPWQQLRNSLPSRLSAGVVPAYETSGDEPSRTTSACARTWTHAPGGS